MISLHLELIDNGRSVIVTKVNSTTMTKCNADLTFAPMNVRVSHIGPISAVVSWLPANSNLQHVIAVNDLEVKVVRKGLYRYLVTGTHTLLTLPAFSLLYTDRCSMFISFIDRFEPKLAAQAHSKRGTWFAYCKSAKYVNCLL